MSSDVSHPAVPVPDVLGEHADQFGRAILGRIKAQALHRGARPLGHYRNSGAPSKITDREGSSRDPMLVGDSLSTVIASFGWQDQLKVAAVTGRWREIVGDQVADHCEPEHFDRGVLTLRASSTAWASQLSLLRGEMLAAFAREIGEGVVVEMKVLGPQTKSFKRGMKSVRGRGPRDTWG